MNTDFVHLHLKSEYSILSGECRINEIAAAAKKEGYTAAAITDAGVLYGAVDFYKACKAEGIKPIIGMEVCVADDDRVNAFKLVLLAKNNDGYKNLCRISTKIQLARNQFMPLTGFAALQEHKDGLYAICGCDAREHIIRLKRIFGEDFYIELCRYNSFTVSLSKRLVSLADELKIETVATNDVTHLYPENEKTLRLLRMIRDAKTFNDDMISHSGRSMKPAAEMTELFSDIPSALNNCAYIASRCNVSFEFGKLHLPKFTPPQPYTPYEYLRFLAENGRKKLEAEGTEYEERAEYELKMIESMGFTEYYLIVHDFVNYARLNGIPVGAGRGSGVGSLISYYIGITGVDPIKHGLLFERFLNPERVSMPDFDIDFCDERRYEVINYVKHKYGADNVAQIINFGTFACRQSVRDAGRVMKLPYAQVDEISRLIPRRIGITVNEALEQSKPFKYRYDNDDITHTLVEYARALEGRPRNISSHASGVVVTDIPLVEYVPLSVTSDIEVTQFPMNTVAELGLLKIDFLGLRYLTVIDDAEKSIGTVDYGKYDDAQTYNMLTSGAAVGLFQLESEGMRNLLQRVAPKNIDDLADVISLYRPGPGRSIDTYMKNRRQPNKTEYINDEMKRILKPTYGCMIYQEQVMEICRALAGFSYGKADIVRRAMAKKKKSEMEEARSGFIDGAAKNGISRYTAEKIFNDISLFASYAFNKSHAAAYAVLAYKTAYLKCHYPEKYLAALLSSVYYDNVKKAEYADECKRMGISVLPPDINKSGAKFTSGKGEVRYGFYSVKNIGKAVAYSIVKERESNGKYKNLSDFFKRSDISSKAAETLARCGTFDCFTPHRSGVVACADEQLSSNALLRRKNAQGQIGFFEASEDDGDIVLPRVPDYIPEDARQYEIELCGICFHEYLQKQYNSDNIMLYIRVNDSNNSSLKTSLGLLNKNGSVPVTLYYEKSGKIFSSDTLRFNCSEAQINKLKALMGANNVIIKEVKSNE